MVCHLFVGRQRMPRCVPNLPQTRSAAAGHEIQNPPFVKRSQPAFAQWLEPFVKIDVAANDHIHIVGFKQRHQRAG